MLCAYVPSSLEPVSSFTRNSNENRNKLNQSGKGSNQWIQTLPKLKIRYATSSTLDRKLGQNRCQQKNVRRFFYTILICNALSESCSLNWETLSEVKLSQFYGMKLMMTVTNTPVKDYQIYKFSTKSLENTFNLGANLSGEFQDILH